MRRPAAVALLVMLCALLAACGGHGGRSRDVPARRAEAVAQARAESARRHSDAAAADACGHWAAKADALALPPFTRTALAARLRGEARLHDGLRRRLAALPAGAGARAGLPALLGGLTSVRDGLRREARLVAAGADVDRGMQAGARADRVVHGLLGAGGPGAGIACPPDPVNAPGRAARLAALGRSCAAFGGLVDRLNVDPATPQGADALLAGLQLALGRFDAGLRRVPVLPRQRHLRRRARRAVAAMRTGLAAIEADQLSPRLPSLIRGVVGHGTQVDAALIRLGATCLDDVPSVPSPGPGPLSPLPPDPATPRLPPGTRSA